MSDDNGERLQNFVDLLRINMAMIVPAVAAAIFVAAIFRAVVDNRDLTNDPSFIPTLTGTFFTTLLDAGNIVAALT